MSELASNKMMIEQPSETSPLFFDNLHFEHFTFVEMFEMEIVEKKGTSFRRLPQTKIWEGRTKDEIRIFGCHFLETPFGRIMIKG